MQLSNNSGLSQISFSTSLNKCSCSKCFLMSKNAKMDCHKQTSGIQAKICGKNVLFKISQKSATWFKDDPLYVFYFVPLHLRIQFPSCVPRVFFLTLIWQFLAGLTYFILCKYNTFLSVSKYSINLCGDDAIYIEPTTIILCIS